MSVEVIEPITQSVPEFSDWIPDSIFPFWQAIDQYPPLGGLVIAGLFFLAAFFIRSVVLRILEKMAKNSDSNFDDEIVQELRKPLFTTVVFFGFCMATKTAELPFGTDALINIFVSVIIGSWMRASFSLSTTILEALARNHHRFPIVEKHTVPLLDLSIKLLVLLIGSYCLLMVWGVNPLGWLASAGIVGIAVGFAAKDTLANLFSGFFILVDAPYKIGDYVNLDSGERGRVTRIGLRSTRLLSRDDIEITLPNALIANAKIVNESGGLNSKIRIRLPIGVAYGSDIDQVCDVLQNVAELHPEICTDPLPRVRMRGFGASSLDFEVLGWIVRPEDRGKIVHEMLVAIYKALAKNGIEIPFTKQDIYVKELPKFSSD
ncbi:MAG: mechanosensitive ion channel family protein [Halioglobus sp.]